MEGVINRVSGVANPRFFRQKGKILLLVFLLVFVNDYAQSNDGRRKELKPKIHFSGFLKYNVTFDTRQTVNAREGNFLLYPEKPQWDTDNNDVNATSSFNMCTINSIMKLNLIGPDVFKAKTQAYVETDFWGSESNKNIDLNHFRLRHTYARLNWNSTELLIGQYWHPMSVAGFFPEVVSSNSGVPFHPISRNPQIRITQSLGRLTIIGCFFTQRDFTSTGPDWADSKYLRSSGMPNMHLQLQMGNDSSTIAGGLGIDYKKIVPELYMTTANGIIKTGKKNSLASSSFVSFMKVRTRFVTAKIQGIYGQNAYDILMIGGYAEKRVTDGQTRQKEFSNLNTLSTWGDIQTTGNKIRLGLFTGYTRNMGSMDIISGPLYVRGGDIRDVYRIAPRIIYMNHPVQISLEGEYTTASYGILNGDMKGGVTDINIVCNFRSLLSVKFNF